MYNNYQEFGPPIMGQEGPEMRGVWTKLHPQYPGPNTLLVRDSVMDGTDMIVITDQGNMPMSEFANNYYRESDEEYNIDGSIKTSSNSQNINPSTISPPPINTSNIDYDLLTSGMGEKPAEPEIPITRNDYYPEEVKNINPSKLQSSTVDIEVSADEETINKVFSKLLTHPELDIVLKWDNFPKSEIDMLIKYFDVSIESIAQYIINKYITNEEINDAVSSKLREYVI